MEILYLNDTNINNLEFLENLENLTYLDLSRTSIKDSSLIHFKSLKNLKTLRIDETEIGDQGVKYIHQFCKEMSRFSLSYTNITQKGVVYISDLKSLSVLDLEGTGIQGKSIEPISKLPQLFALNISSFLKSPSREKRAKGFLGYEINEIKYLSSLPKLSILKITCLEYISEISSLNKMNNLTTLSIDWPSFSESDLKKILDLPKLTKIYINLVSDNLDGTFSDLNLRKERRLYLKEKEATKKQRNTEISIIYDRFYFDFLFHRVRPKMPFEK